MISGTHFTASRAAISCPRAGWPTGDIESGRDALVKRFHRAHFSAHAVAGERQAVCIMDKAVKDGICEGRISDHLEPLIDRQLAGHNGRATTLAIIEDFKQVATLGR